jgi:hypothetical protein
MAEYKKFVRRYLNDSGKTVSSQVLHEGYYLPKKDGCDISYIEPVFVSEAEKRNKLNSYFSWLFNCFHHVDEIHDIPDGYYAIDTDDLPYKYQ